MAISDTERREVARKLRALADGESPMTECSVDALYIALGLPCSGTGIECAVIGYLADLIDRPTCKNSEYLYDGSFFECSECGERWELTCGSPADNNLCFCPRCGAEVVS